MITNIIQQQLEKEGFKIVDKGYYELRNPFAMQLNNIPIKPKILKFLDNLLPYRIVKRTLYSNLMDVKNTSEERFKQFMGMVK